jgi:hypothetical protein
MAEGMDADVDQEQMTAAASDAASDPALLAAMGSVLLSLYVYYLAGNQRQGIFIGLWAPTFLAFANYLRQQDIDEQIVGAV